MTRKDGSTKTLLDGYRYTNGVCMAHDNKSLFFAESWACRIHRYWLEGPKAGTAECVIRDMPGYPDNINRASDGTYWMAWLGMRTPSFDLSLRHPGMRKRMARRLPQDEWLFPNINTGGVVKFDESGEILQTMGDLTGAVASDGHLDARAQGAVSSSAASSTTASAGYAIDGADPDWTGDARLLGAAAMIFDPILDIFRGKAVTIPPLDGAFRPNTALDDAPVFAAPARARQSGRCWQGRVVASPAPNLMALGRRPILHRAIGADVTALAVSPDRRSGGRARGWQPADRRARRFRCRPASPASPRWPMAPMGGCGWPMARRSLPPSDWAADLMKKSASGSVWRRSRRRFAQGGGWPGLALWAVCPRRRA